MKKITALVLVIILLFSVVCLQGCDGNGTDTTPLFAFKMSRFKPWLSNTNTDEVVRMEMINSTAGVAPGTRITCYYTEDTNIISAYLEYYAELKVTLKLIPELVGGGGTSKSVFTFADGSQEILSNSPSGYSNGLIYLTPHTDISPDLEYEGEMNKFYRFESHSKAAIKIYTFGEKEELVEEKIIDQSDLFFTEYAGEVSEDAVPTHYLETDFGKLYIYSDTLCYIDEIPADEIPETTGFYELYNGSFSDIIEN